MLDTVQEIQERHSAVKDLERQLLGLHQIFLDMAILVEAQGELLDNIETQVAKANEYVNQGNKALGQAKELQKNTRKYMCCAMMCLLTIVAIVVLAVIKPWKARRWLGCCACGVGADSLLADGRCMTRRGSPSFSQKQSTMPWRMLGACGLRLAPLQLTQRL